MSFFTPSLPTDSTGGQEPVLAAERGEVAA